VQLNHLDLQTTDVQALAAFFVDQFDFVRRSNERSPAIAILADEAGFVLVIQRHVAPAYPEGFHIGFLHGEAGPVRAHRERLLAAGFTPTPIEVDNRGTRFYLRGGPDALLIEVSSPSRV
jgi:hypothetical protein